MKTKKEYFFTIRGPEHQFFSQRLIFGRNIIEGRDPGFSNLPKIIITLEEKDIVDGTNKFAIEIDDVPGKSKYFQLKLSEEWPFFGHKITISEYLQKPNQLIKEQISLNKRQDLPSQFNALVDEEVKADNLDPLAIKTKKIKMEDQQISDKEILETLFKLDKQFKELNKQPGSQKEELEIGLKRWKLMQKRKLAKDNLFFKVLPLDISLNPLQDERFVPSSNKQIYLFENEKRISFIKRIKSAKDPRVFLTGPQGVGKSNTLCLYVLKARGILKSNDFNINPKERILYINNPDCYFLYYNRPMLFYDLIYFLAEELIEDPNLQKQLLKVNFTNKTEINDFLDKILELLKSKNIKPVLAIDQQEVIERKKSKTFFCMKNIWKKWKRTIFTIDFP